MTRDAGSVTGTDDASRRVPGAMDAGVVIGAPDAQHLAHHAIDMANGRHRDDNDDVKEHAHNAHVFGDDAKQAHRAQQAREMLRNVGRNQQQAAAIHLVQGRTSPADDADGKALAVPGAPRPQLTKEQAFAVVKDARTLIDVKEPKESSQEDYRGKAAWLWKMVADDQLEETDGDRWCRAIGAYVQQPQSFKAYRAACLWTLRTKLRRMLAEQDQMQRNGERGEGWMQRVALISELAADYRTVQGFLRTPPEPLEGHPPPPRESKKPDLRRIAKEHPDWMARMLLKARHTKYLDAIRVLSMVGPRPEELESGSEVALSGPGMFSITINGAKTNESAGQPWRRIHLPVVLLPHAWRQRLDAAGRFVVQIGSKDGLRKCLHRLSEKALRTRSSLRKLPFATAYVYRHAFATRLRNAGFEAEEIAAVMGHSVAETQATYGIKAGGRGKRKIKRVTGLRVEVPRVVRSLDRSGLSKVQGKIEAGKNKSGHQV